MTKEPTMKEILAEANKQIFNGKSAEVKDHLLALIGKRDGVKVRLSETLKKIEAELAEAETNLKNFSELSVEDAYNKITIARSSGIVGSTGSSWSLINSGSVVFH